MSSQGNDDRKYAVDSKRGEEEEEEEQLEVVNYNNYEKGLDELMNLSHFVCIELLIHI